MIYTNLTLQKFRLVHGEVRREPGNRIVRQIEVIASPRQRAEYKRLRRSGNYSQIRKFELRLEAGNGAELSSLMEKGRMIVREVTGDYSPH